MFKWLKRFRRQPERVSFDEQRIVRTLPSGKEESLQWSDLAEITIFTTDEGPWAEDVYWLFMAADGATGCAVGGSAEGFDRLLKRLQELPGFDNDSVILAMGSTSNDRFPVWRRTEVDRPHE